MKNVKSRKKSKIDDDEQDRGWCEFGFRTDFQVRKTESVKKCKKWNKWRKNQKKTEGGLLEKGTRYEQYCL